MTTGEQDLTGPTDRDRYSSERGANEHPDKLAALVGARTVGETSPEVPAGARGARAAAVQALYESDLSGHPGDDAVERLALFADASNRDARLSRNLVAHVEAHRMDLDEKIGSLASQYPPEQIAAVDRNVLRVALAELEIRPDTPPAVVVNEAVEIAKLFGSDSSGKFVNGVLGALLR